MFGPHSYRKLPLFSRLPTVKETDKYRGYDPGSQHVFLMDGLSGMHEKNVWFKMTAEET